MEIILGTKWVYCHYCRYRRSINITTKASLTFHVHGWHKHQKMFFKKIPINSACFVLDQKVSFMKAG